ncbi:hypothetical protein WAI453_010252 [Rhynchosporium graminicola]|uniref:2EXR domain-containing protein n=1 Tax=Rhynchosporium graminicola TaxID=2792576 RepID=A0A1E1KFW6_9HELO|nr:uncharacterized protein RCO7_02686 [Rhynchosporium commune]
MELIQTPGPPRQTPGNPTTGFPHFSKLPAEIRCMIYKEVNSVERIVRLDVGIDNPPALIHAFYESRKETQKQFTMNQGTIRDDESDPGTVATPKARYRIWINKNGRDILHLTPLYRPSFLLTNFIPAAWASFAETNCFALDLMTCIETQGDRPFQNIRRVMFESGKQQHQTYDELVEDWEEHMHWSDVYRSLWISYPKPNPTTRLGIQLNEMLIVWKDKQFDPPRVDLEDLEERARCVMPRKLQPHCEDPGCPQRPYHCYAYNEGAVTSSEGILLSTEEISTMANIARSFVITMDIYHEPLGGRAFAALKDEKVNMAGDKKLESIEPKWPDVVLLRQK